MADIHNFENSFRRIVERIEKSGISEVNKKAILGFKEYLLSEGIGYPKITKYLYDLVKLDNALRKPFNEATEQDLRRVVSEINQTSLSEHTKRGFKLVLRKFYCFVRGFKKKGVYPPEVEWISLKISKKNSKLPEELLNVEDIAFIRTTEQMKMKDAKSLREEFQYGTKTSVNKEILSNLLKKSKEIVEKIEVILTK